MDIADRAIATNQADMNNSNTSYQWAIVDELLQQTLEVQHNAAVQAQSNPTESDLPQRGSLPTNADLNFQIERLRNKRRQGEELTAQEKEKLKKLTGMRNSKKYRDKEREEKEQMIQDELKDKEIQKLNLKIKQL